MIVHGVGHERARRPADGIDCGRGGRIGIRDGMRGRQKERATSTWEGERKEEGQTEKEKDKRAIIVGQAMANKHYSN